MDRADSLICTLSVGDADAEAFAHWVNQPSRPQCSYLTGTSPLQANHLHQAADLDAVGGRLCDLALLFRPPREDQRIH